METIVKLAQAMDELAYIIREHNAKFQAELEHLFPLYCVEVNELRAIEVLNRNQNHLSVQKATTSSPDCSGKSYDNECICSALKKEISKLRMEMISKNRKIQALELQISKLIPEIKQLKMAMLGIKEGESEMTNKIEEEESDHEEYSSVSVFEKEIKEEIQEIRNKLRLSLNSLNDLQEPAVM